MSQSGENDSNRPNHPDSNATTQHPGSEDFGSSYSGPPRTLAFAALQGQASGYGYGYGYGAPSGYGEPSGYPSPGYGQDPPPPGYAPGPGHPPTRDSKHRTAIRSTAT